ncbi:MAG TPA: MFS transporter [Dehalococcoidia bacterium]|nr:MFS transporter [Dehalococcoidia bacterium]HIN24788.1 MFS transporter [Dehalococcoidia bacterium]
MRMFAKNTYYGWFVVAGCVLVSFGVAGGQFSFGVFLKPMTDEFGWSRGSLSLAFALTFMISGLLRPLAGYLADRYSPKAAVLSGVAVMGVILLLIPFISTLGQLYALFAIMSIGITLGTGPILTKIVSGWFHTRRGLTLGLVSGAGSMGAMVLVPAASLFLVLLDWKDAYWFLALLLLVLVLPAGFLLIRNRPQDMGLEPLGASENAPGSARAARSDQLKLLGRDATFREALRTPLFVRLTMGYFV